MRGTILCEPGRRGQGQGGVGSEEDRPGKLSNKAATDDNPADTWGTELGFLEVEEIRFLSNGVSKKRMAVSWLTKSPVGVKGIQKDQHPESRGQTDSGS